jgi:hypothetical protein
MDLSILVGEFKRKGSPEGTFGMETKKKISPFDQNDKTRITAPSPDVGEIREEVRSKISEKFIHHPFFHQIPDLTIFR